MQILVVKFLLNFFFGEGGLSLPNSRGHSHYFRKLIYPGILNVINCHLTNHIIFSCSGYRNPYVTEHPGATDKNIL